MESTAKTESELRKESSEWILLEEWQKKVSFLLELAVK